MFKKGIPYFIVSLVLALLLFGLIQKEKLHKIISELMQENAQSETFHSAAELVRTRYNYTENNLNYSFTLLEFGSTGCTVCKQMEPVLEEVKNSVDDKINVVFVHTMNPDNQKLVEYFGISAIPMQVLLDQTGEVFFKHYGFLAAKQILAETKNYSLTFKKEKNENINIVYRQFVP